MNKIAERERETEKAGQGQRVKKRKRKIDSEKLEIVEAVVTFHKIENLLLLKSKR